MGADMIKNRPSFTWLFVPLVVYLALMAVLFYERAGVSFETVQAPARFLEPTDQPMASGYTEPAAESLILFDSVYPQEQIIVESVTGALDSMRVRYEKKDVIQNPGIDLQKYKIIVIAFYHLDHFNQTHELIDWVQNGGRVLFAARPFISENFRSLYRKIGIQSMADQDVVVGGLYFKTDLLPGAQGKRFVGVGEFLKFFAYPVQLESSSILHITSADTYELPLLWESEYGRGRFVVLNTSQLAGKVNRGIYGAAYSLLEDVIAYPVINTSVFFLDNFPAPLPEGENPRVTKETGRNVRNFYLDLWWPDMLKLAQKYQIKYSGLLVETYNLKTEPPFTQETSLDDHRYLGRMLLRSGGELILQGYNHVPYCLNSEGVNDKFLYPGWPSVENQQMSLKALAEFAEKLFPGQQYSVYAPPSYILCPTAREWLSEVLPGIKVISSILVEEEAQTYVQDFTEGADGIIEFPRIVSGNYLYDYMQLALINELSLQYVNSHSITSDDILDPVRSADREWKQMRDQFEEQLAWLQKNAPGLRNMTASEGAMAVQRFSRLQVSSSLDGNIYSIHLQNFYDQAFLMLRSRTEPVGITGGKITPVTSSLFLIQANQPDIKIELRNNP
jgi:hypothetical protein